MTEPSVPSTPEPSDPTRVLPIGLRILIAASKDGESLFPPIFAPVNRKALEDFARQYVELTVRLVLVERERDLWKRQAESLREALREGIDCIAALSARVAQLQEASRRFLAAGDAYAGILQNVERDDVSMMCEFAEAETLLRSLAGVSHKNRG